MTGKTSVKIDGASIVAASLMNAAELRCAREKVEFATAYDSVLLDWQSQYDLLQAEVQAFRAARARERSSLHRFVRRMLFRKD